MLMVLLSITVLGAGGPPRSVSAKRDVRLPNATIAVIQRRAPVPRLLARSHTGRLELRVAPGTYILRARLSGAAGRGSVECETTTVSVARSPRHVNLYCPIK